jgi:HEAT repeat protein
LIPTPDQIRVFRDAVRAGDLHVVKQLLQTTPNLLFIGDDYYGSVVRAAADSPHLDVADYLAHSLLERLREGTVPDEYGAIHDLGEAAHSTTGYRGCEILRAEAEPVVAGFLADPEPNLRYIAIGVLSFHWDMTRYARVFQQVSQGDRDDSVRGMALSAMGWLLRGTRDHEAAQLLINMLRDSTQEALDRKHAYEELVLVWQGWDASTALSVRKTEREKPLREAAKKATTRSERMEIERHMDRAWEDFVDWDFVAQVEGEVMQQSN